MRPSGMTDPMPIAPYGPGAFSANIGRETNQ
jgi:hypothetical protein